MKAAVVVEVHELAPAQLAEAQEAIAELKRLSSTQATVERQLISIELDIGRALSVLVGGGYFRAATGQSKAEWLAENLRFEGRPVSESKAECIVRDWKVISRFPVVELALREGINGVPFTCRTSTYFACGIALDGKWLEREVESYLASHKPLTTKVAKEAQEHARTEVDRRILELLHTRSSTELRNDYYAQKIELRLQKGDIPMEWVRIKGSVPKMVRDKMDSVIIRAGLLSGDDVDPKTATLTQLLERLAGWGEDTLDALDAINNGNSGPLQSLIEQGKRARRA